MHENNNHTRIPTAKPASGFAAYAQGETMRDAADQEARQAVFMTLLAGTVAMLAALTFM